MPIDPTSKHGNRLFADYRLKCQFYFRLKFQAAAAFRRCFYSPGSGFEGLNEGSMTGGNGVNVHIIHFKADSTSLNGNPT